jgi:hypothetical protein
VSARGHFFDVNEIKDLNFQIYKALGFGRRRWLPGF